MEWQELVSAQKLSEMKSAITLLTNWMRSSYQLPLLENMDSFFQEKERIASLLVDNHLGKLARKIRLLGELNGVDSITFLNEWKEIALFTSLWKGFDQLPEGQQLNLIYQSGPNITKKHLNKEKPVTDRFLLVGKTLKEEERLLLRIMYLYAERTKRYFAMLDYSFNRNPFERSYHVGEVYEGNVVRYPFPGSQRISPVSWKIIQNDGSLSTSMISRSVAEAVRAFSMALKINPFCEFWPVMIEVTSTLESGVWVVRDKKGDNISMVDRDFNKSAPFYALTYLSPVMVVALLSKKGFHPLSYFNGEYLVPFAETESIV